MFEGRKINELLSFIAKLMSDDLPPRRFEKQFYHYKGKKWRVKDLYLAASSIEPYYVPVEELGEKTWKAFEQKTRKEVARHVKLILAADIESPILLSSEGRVMDGNHRIAKAVLMGEKHILAKRFSIDPAPYGENPMPESLRPRLRDY